MLIDENLNLVALTDTARRWFRKSMLREGHCTEEDFSRLFTMAFPLMCRRVMENGVGSGFLEALPQMSTSTPGLLSILVRPLVDRSTGASFAQLTFEDVTLSNAVDLDISNRAAGFEDSAIVQAASQMRTSASSSFGRQETAPLVDFLLETLASKPSIRSRKGISYLTIRTWRAPIKEYQLKAVSALKRSDHELLAESVAKEIIQHLKSLVGSPNFFKCVSAIPCGHSKRDDCLSLTIAKGLGKQLRIPYVQVFENEFMEGKSHPKTNKKRPPIKIKQKVEGPLLLVDDIATSGAHLEEAVKAIQPHCGSVMPVAWIGGS